MIRAPMMTEIGVRILGFTIGSPDALAVPSGDGRGWTQPCQSPGWQGVSRRNRTPVRQGPWFLLSLQVAAGPASFLLSFQLRVVARRRGRHRKPCRSRGWRSPTCTSDSRRGSFPSPFHLRIGSGLANDERVHWGSDSVISSSPVPQEQHLTTARPNVLPLNCPYGIIARNTLGQGWGQMLLPKDATSGAGSPGYLWGE
jgi:hypothetical protein